MVFFAQFLKRIHSSDRVFVNLKEEVKMPLYRFFLILLFPLSFLFAEESLDPPFSKEESVKLEIHNAILSRIHGKNISLVDLIKKMNQTMYQHYPKQMQSPAFRYQFYNTRWKFTLDEAIDHELILADAESKEIKVSDSEIHEELEKRFGPDIVITLDKLHLTLEEAKQSIKEELILQKMLGNYVYYRAMTTVTPEKIYTAYNEIVEAHHGMESWNYQVLSFRGNDAEKLAHKMILLKDKKQPPNELLALLTEKAKEFKEATFQISSELEISRKDASDDLLSILGKLSEKTYSDPCEQMSRADQKKVIRVFYLKQHQVKEIPSFATKSEEIRKNLFNKAVETTFTQYTNSLRKKFHLESQKEIAENYQPFSLQ